MQKDDSERSIPHDETALPDVHTAQRSGAVIAVLATTAVLFIAGLANPMISAAVGVSVEQGVLVVSVFLGAVILASAAFYRFGPASRLYRCCDYLESFALTWSIAYLIRASSSVQSFFWIFHGVQVFATALAGYSWIYLATVCAGPAYLVAEFVWHGESASAWLSAIAGICGVFVYLLVARLSSQRDAALRREAALRQQLARVLVAQERVRISRDLHDNIATELTGLVWRVREISGVVPSGPYTPEIVGVAERLRSVIADLRNVVLGLRDPELAFDELKLIIERRCRELCGPTDLRVTIDGQLDEKELSVFHQEVAPMCFELVSNAARHAHAHRIELTLGIETRLRIVVSDDGSGVSPSAWQSSRGGLHGVRQRVQRLRGSVTLEPTPVGSLFVIDLPRPLGIQARPRPDRSRERTDHVE